MSPIQYIKRTREHFEKLGFPPYKWTENADCPYWTPLKKPLEKCRVALLSTGGLYIKDRQPPFNPERDDLTFREIPKDVDPRMLAISHDNYDHADAEKDINVVFPIERLRDLEKEGYIGEFAPIAYTIMGRIFRRSALQQELAPQLLQKLKEAKVDVFLLVPAWPICHQTVGLIARTVEEAGIPTMVIGSARDVMEAVKAPRAVFVNFPLGHQTGKPFNRALQTNILKDAFGALKSINKPCTIVDLPYKWRDSDGSWESEAS